VDGFGLEIGQEGDAGTSSGEGTRGDLLPVKIHAKQKDSCQTTSRATDKNLASSPE
jgi:hypothetical protein